MKRIEVPSAAGRVRQLLGAALFVLGGLGFGSSQAATVSASSFSAGVVNKPIVGQVFLGTVAAHNEWFAVNTTSQASPLFLLGVPEANSGKYSFLSSTNVFNLASVTVAINGGQSVSQDGWLEFYRSGTAGPVATGEKGAKAGVYVPSMSFLVGSADGSPRTFTMTASNDLNGLQYDRILLVYRKESAAPQSVGISTMQIQGVAVVPEPSTYAMMLAGIAAIGFMTRRRRQSQD